MIDVIAFDADDTLWHNEGLYSAAQDRLEVLLARYGHKDGVRQALYETEKVNMANYGYGYGLKSFTLSMIETAIRLTEGRVRASDIQALIEVTKEMRRAPVRLLDHVAEVIPALAASYPLMVITKRRDCGRKERGGLSLAVAETPDRSGALSDGRQLAALRRPAGRRPGRQCGAHFLPYYLGARDGRASG